MVDMHQVQEPAGLHRDWLYGREHDERSCDTVWVGDGMADDADCPLFVLRNSSQLKRNVRIC